MHRKKLKIRDSARNYCLSLIKKKLSQNQYRLPTMHDLARDSGFSHVTIMKVIQELEMEEYLESKQGTGIRIISKDLKGFNKNESINESLEKKKRNLYVWERVANDLRRGIISGHYAPGRKIPQKKELCITYGVSVPTMTRALKYLESQRLITRELTHYTVPRVRVVKNEACLVFAFRGRKESIAEHFSPRLKKIFRIIEQTCLTQKLTLVPAPIYIIKPQTYVSASQWEREVLEKLNNRPIIGIIFWNFSLTYLDFAVYLQKIKSFNRPVSFLIDPFPEVPHNVGKGKGELLNIRTLNDITAGRDVGRYIRAKGLKTFAYLSFNSAVRWQTDRYRGLVEEIRGTYSDRYFFETGEEIKHRQVDNKSPEYHEAKTAMLKLGHVKDDHRWFNAISHSRFNADCANIVHRWKMLESVYWLMGEIFAREHPEIICGCNDSIALAARQILTLPEFSAFKNTEVIGFDDSDEALYGGMTSYNFNDEGFVMTGLQFILNPDSALFQNTEMVTINGFLNLRDY